MTVEFKDLKPGHEYMFKSRLAVAPEKEPEQVMFIASHPHDGAYLIVEGYDEEEDSNVFFACVREELTCLP